MSSVSPQFKLTILLFLLIAMIFISFLLGRFHLSAADVISVFGGWMGFVPETRSASHVVMELRLPRIIGAVMVGAALSVSGAAYQVMFRNPMVSPAILGVSAGAAFGAAVAILWSVPSFFVHAATFLGGLCAVGITYVIGAKFCRGGNTTLAIILSGIIMSTLFTSLLSMIKYVADPCDKLPVIVYWLMGGLFLLASDNLARTLWTMEIPLGILTSLFGVPFFLYLLVKYHHGWD